MSIASIAPTLATSYLPAEIWGQVMSYVDNLHLWVVCRQVSKALRSEAEREFAKHRFKNLHIHWDSAEPRAYLSKPAGYTFFASTKHLLSISPDGLRATFSVSMVYQKPACTYQNVHPDPKMDIKSVHKCVHKLLSNFDDDFGLRLGQSPELSQVCQLGPYFCDAPIPKLEFELAGGKISFEWKSFLNGFFGVYAHAQDMARHMHCTELDDTAAEDELLQRFYGRKNITWSDRQSWVRSYGSGLALGCLQDAYVKRLARFHEAIGVDLKPNLNHKDESFDTIAWTELRSYINDIRKQRNEYFLACS
jgi:hypothetical protein